MEFRLLTHYLPIMNETSEIPKIPTIHMGRSRSAYFPIIKTIPGIEITVNQPVHCLNPKTKQVTTGVVTKYTWSFDWNEVPIYIEGMILWGWSISPAALRTALVAADPEFKDDWARIVLIRETI